MGRTDGLTDGRTRRRLYASPKFFGEHKNRWILSSSGTGNTRPLKDYGAKRLSTQQKEMRLCLV